MNEKAFKTMGIAGAASVAIGIVTIVVGLAVGVIAVVSGAKLLGDRKGLTF